MATGRAWGRLLTIAFLCFGLSALLLPQDVLAAADVQVTINGAPGGANEVYVEKVGGAYHAGPCNTTCPYTTAPELAVQFRAVAGEPGWKFSHWSAPGYSINGDTTLTSSVLGLPPSGLVSVTANFVMIDYTLTVTSTGGTGGSTDRVTVSSPGPYHYGDVVTLTANPQAGETLSGWSANVVPTGPTTGEITMNNNEAVTATFAFINYTLTVTSTGGTGGSTDRVTVSSPGPYHYGDVVTLTANPQAGETFSGWSANVVPTGPTTGEITMNNNEAVTATFAFINYTLTVTSTGGTGGSTDRVTVSSPGPYHYGDVVTLTANPQAGETFSGWSANVVPTGPTTGEITMNNNEAVTATFAFINYTLTVTSTGGTGGSTDRVTVSSPGPYHYGDVVTLTANPQAGETFSGWSANVVPTGPTTGEITMNNNEAVTATFAFINYTLTVTSTGGTGGSTDRVTVSSPGPYHYGDVVTLTANPQAGETFSGWSANVVPTGPTTGEITMNNNEAVTATFAFINYTLTVTSTGGTGGSTGRVTVSSPGPYHYGDVVTLTANPQAGETFSGWSANVVPTGPTTGEITMNNNEAVTATFAFINYTLTVTSTGGTGGSTDRVTVSSPGPYHYGDVVTLTANPQAGETFSGWSANVVPTGPTTGEITMNNNEAVTATFAFINYTLTVTSTGGTGGSTGRVTVSSPGPYHYGDVVTLTANPQAGETFSGWSANVVPTGPTTGEITMNNNEAVTATFAFINYTLTVTSTGGTGGSTGRVTVSSPGPYHYGDVVTLTANPQAGETFSGWSANVVPTGPTTGEITMNNNEAVTATFAFINYTLTVTSTGGTGGSTDRVTVSSPGPYHYGDVVTLTANPQAGETFSGWSANVVPTGPTTGEITMNNNEAVTATFAFINYTLTVTSTGGTGGSTDRVTVSSPGPYHYGDVVTLTANPQAGETFSGWSANVVPTGPTTGEITMNNNEAVTATFDYIEYNISITITEPLSGASVNKSPDKVTYHYGETVTLTAVPGTGEQFASWSGDGVDVGGPPPQREITFDGNKAVTATFDYIEYTLTVTSAGGMGGATDRVTVVPSQLTYHYGDVVTLTANPQSGEIFASWSGDGVDVGGPPPQREITFDGDKAVTANFSFIEYTLNISIIEPFPGGGTAVSKSPDQATYHYGEVVALTAVLGTGEIFTGWSGDITDTAISTSITMDSNKSVTATFDKQSVTLNMQVSFLEPGAFGTVTPDIGSHTYLWGDTVSVTATPDVASTEFVSWTPNVVGGVVTMNGNQTVIATFDLRTFTVTFHAGDYGTLDDGSTTDDTIVQNVRWGQNSTVVTGVADVHYHFLKWVNDADGTVMGTNPSLQAIHVIQNLDFTGHFEIDKYTLTFTGGNFGDVEVGGTSFPVEYQEIVDWKH